MIDKYAVRDLLLCMSKDFRHNVKMIEEGFGSLNYRDETDQTILHLLVDEKYNEKKCFLAIQSLLQIGFDPNYADDYGYNFIQNALFSGYSETFILNIISESLKYHLDVNHVDLDHDTIVHTAMLSDDYLGEVINIYNLLCDHGFDSMLVNNDDMDLLGAMEYAEKFTEAQIQKFEKAFSQRRNKLLDGKTDIKSEEVVSTIYTLSELEIEELEQYGKVLNRKTYLSAPTIGREKELKHLIVSLAQDKKRPIIVGESGVGKTALVDELAYRIQIGQVPSFLRGRIIFEINPGDVVAGSHYVGMFEKRMTELMKLCEKYDVVAFIDEIHTIYGVGSSESKDLDMASMLKYYIDRSNLKVIGTTTEEEYQKYFSNDALKRRFEKIIVKEPSENILYQIIDKVLDDYSMKSGITFKNDNIKEQIITVILDFTKRKCRIYNDVVQNPDLAISIIDKAFAFAKVEDCEVICSSHFEESFECCDRIYDYAKEQAISRLKNLDENISKKSSKILQLDFYRTRK